MPLALILIAGLIFLTAVKGNYPAVGAQFNQTFFGTAASSGAPAQSGFIVWAGSVFGLAVIFRAIQAPRAGELFIGLLILVYFLNHDGVLQQIEDAIGGAGSTASAPVATGTPLTPQTPQTPQVNATGAAGVGAQASGNNSAPPPAPAPTGALGWFYNQILGTRPAN